MSKGASHESKRGFLRGHGSERIPESLDQRLREAAERLRWTNYRREVRFDLTAAEGEVLEQGGFNLKPEKSGLEDPLARTITEFAALLARSLSRVEAAKRLGLDRSQIQQRLTSKPPSLYGIRIGSYWYIPEFQFEGKRLIGGIEEVVAHLDPELHPISVFRWFTTPHPDLYFEGLSLSPRDWLLRGLPGQPVVEFATNL